MKLPSKPWVVIATFSFAILAVSVLINRESQPRNDVKSERQVLETAPVEVAIDKTRLANATTTTPAPSNDSEHPKQQISQTVAPRGTMSYDDEWCTYSDLSQEGYETASAEKKDWALARGYMTDIANTYEGYDIATLTDLAEQGDFLALYNITKIVDKNDLEFTKPLWAAYQAMLYGATGGAAMFIETMNFVRVMQYARQGNEEGTKARLIETLSWIEFRNMRGDPDALGYGITMVKDILNVDVKLNEKDLNEITNRATRIYNELNEKRISLGLPPFDDAMPKHAQIAYLLNIAKLKMEGWDGWGKKYIDAETSECLEANLDQFRQSRTPREEPTKMETQWTLKVMGQTE